MYEGGIPTDALIEHHRQLALGGVGMTTVSYGAISDDGRSFEDQMVIGEHCDSQLSRLVTAVHEAGSKVSIQLTHCGYFSKNKETRRLLSASRTFNAYGSLSGLLFSNPMNPNDMNQIKNDFVNAAKRIKSLGFDAIELHMGHGYLLSQFLSPITNRRKDEYGGSIENRSRFPLEVFDAVSTAVGREFPVLVKLNLHDGFNKGFDLKDCIHVIKELEERGCAAVILSGGFTSKTPFFMMRGKIPWKGMIQNARNWAEKLSMSLFGPLLIPSHKFEPLFFYEMAKEVRKNVSIDLVYVGGVASKKHIELLMQSGFNWIALARPLIQNPNFVNEMKKGITTESACNRCNQCIVEMERGGIRCTL